MGDQDHGDFFLGPDVLQLALQARTGQGIERTQRFIQQEHARSIDQAAGDRHALRHAAGYLMWVGIDKVLEADQFDVLAHGVAFLCSAQG
ncbi:hypothetical protein D3C85_1504500 [compost metagenome]